LGVAYSEHIEGDGAAAFKLACAMGLEGIVSKRRDSSYRSGPTRSWVKTKNPSSPGVRRFQSSGE
jgi:bifunctional non-homologous end joining protein LigD